MNPSHVIAHFRRREHALMTSTCTIVRRTGTTTWDDATGDYTAETSTVYSGPCRLSAPNRTTSDVEAGNAAYAITDYTVALPLDTVVRVDDLITIVTSDDPIAAGLRLTVTAVPKSDWQVIRRAHCQEFTQEPT